MIFRELALAAIATLALSMTPHAVADPLKGVYVGANLGTTMQDANRGMMGANIGYQFCNNFAGEGTYDYNQVTGSPNNAQMLMFNAVAGYPNSSPFTPYVLGGTGVGWNAAGNTTSNSALGLWDVGAGFKVAIFYGHHQFGLKAHQDTLCLGTVGKRLQTAGAHADFL